MAIELVTGHTGEAHISSADVGALIAGVCGSGVRYLGGAPALTMTDANTLSIGPCELLAQGRHVRITGATTAKVSSGSQSGHRIDRVVLRYALASDGTESVSVAVVQGETSAGAASLPALPNPGSVLDGATAADWEIARVSVDGLAPTATLAIRAAQGDPVWHRGRFVADGCTCSFCWDSGRVTVTCEVMGDWWGLSGWSNVAGSLFSDWTGDSTTGIPAGWRPSQRVYFPAVCADGMALKGYAAPDGSIWLMGREGVNNWCFTASWPCPRPDGE